MGDELCPRLVICGLDGLAAEALDDASLEGIHQAMLHYRSDELIPQLLATIEALRHPWPAAERS